MLHCAIALASTACGRGHLTCSACCLGFRLHVVQENLRSVTSKNKKLSGIVPQTSAHLLLPDMQAGKSQKK